MPESIVKRITEHLTEHIGCLVSHAPGSYEEILKSKSSSTWGWKNPLQFEGCLIVYHQYSAQSPGGVAGIVYDFKRDE